MNQCIYALSIHRITSYFIFVVIFHFFFFSFLLSSSVGCRQNYVLRNDSCQLRIRKNFLVHLPKGACQIKLPPHLARITMLYVRCNSAIIIIIIIIVLIFINKNGPKFWQHIKCTFGFVFFSSSVSSFDFFKKNSFQRFMTTKSM